MTNPPISDVAWRTENLGALLFAARERCIRDKLATLHAHRFGAMTDAQLALFHHMDPGGSRLTDIAIRAGMTKSSVSELVDRAAMLGLVERVPDDTDRRAKLVDVTRKGMVFLEQLDAAIAFADRRFADAVGEVALRKAISSLTSLAETPSGIPAPAPHNIGRLLGNAAKHFARHVLDVVHDLGHLELGEPQLTLFRSLDLGGSRLTELAARAGVTKQSMRETVEATTTFGYLVQRPDPADGRARIIALTTEGLAVLDRFREGVERAERRALASLGATALAELRDLLKTYIAAATLATA